VDLTGAWQFISLQELLGLVRAEPVYAHGGRGRYGLSLSPPPSDATVSSWVLGDLLQHFDIASRYPGLAASEVNLRVDSYA
jgi:hypothetical protein